MSIFERQQLLQMVQSMLVRPSDTKVLEILLDVLDIHEVTVPILVERLKFELEECQTAIDTCSITEQKLQIDKAENEAAALNGKTCIVDRDFADYLYRMNEISMQINVGYLSTQ